MGEERLAALLHEAAPPSEGVAFDDVVRRVRRRRAARWATAVGVVAVAGVVGGVALTLPSSPPSTRVATGVDLTGTVPWVDLPPTPYQAPPAPSGPVPTDARDCTAGDVTASFDGRDGATGHLVNYVVFRNTSSSTCVLKGFPARVTASEPGKPDVVATNGSYFPQSTTANMAPGGTTLLGLQTDSLCPANPAGAKPAQLYHHVDITLTGGGTVTPAGPTDGLNLTCGLHLTRFYVEEQAPVAPHDPLSDLAASLELPQTAKAGEPLVYVVDLTNPTNEPVSFDRWCPSYLEAPTKESYTLNCATVSSIAAGQTVRYEMRLQVPDDAAVTLTVRWEMTGPGLPSAQGTVPLAAP